LASLSNGAVDSLFKQLREDFDFVVVDTSPILPVADARFVSQYVDTVVLSVFRDISEAPKIQAACDILAAFGANCVEAVVTGPSHGLYGRHVGYEATVSS
jgi:Mrp family chromosome partitioning ATPase